MSSKPTTRKGVGPVRDGEAEIGEQVTVLDLTTCAVRDYRLVERDEESTETSRSAPRSDQLSSGVTSAT